MEAGACVSEFDRAMESFNSISHDEDGEFDGPALRQDVHPDARSLQRPQPRTMGPPGGEELGIAEFRVAVECGALRTRSRSGVDRIHESASEPDPPVSDSSASSGWAIGVAQSWSELWHPVLAVYRSSSNRERARLIADMRGINSLFPPPPSFVLPSFVNAIPWAQTKWAMKLDLVSAFWSLRMGPRLRSMFNCVGKGEAFTWWGMPMGWSYAPLYFHTVLEPALAYVRALGWNCGKYLDDFIVAELTAQRCQAAFDCLREVIRRLGFIPCPKKTSVAPTQDIVFLGMGIDLICGYFYWPADKATRVIEWAQGAMGLSHIRRDELQSWLGRTVFLSTCCPILSSWRRALEHSLAGQEGSRQAFIPVSERMREELTFWSGIESQVGTSFPFSTGSRIVLRTDASDVAGGIRVCYEDGQWREFTIPLPLWLRPRSSAARELYVTLAGLRILETTVPLWRVSVDVYTDSQASVGAMTRGGHADDMVELTRVLLDFQVRNTSVVRPFWIPRESLMREDALSRVVRKDESMFDPIAREALGALLPMGIQIDLFANVVNAARPRFVSLVPGQGIGFDGLLHPLEPGVWAFPPFALARPAAKRLAGADVPAILIAPAGYLAGGFRWMVTIPKDEKVLISPPDFSSPAVPSPVRLCAYVYGVPAPSEGEASLVGGVVTWSSA